MAQQWSSAAIGYSRKNVTDPVPEIVFTGNEDGVQGRFFQSVGHVVGAVLRVHGIESFMAVARSSYSIHHHILTFG